MIHVHAAVIVSRDRMLLSQRRDDTSFSFTWEAPGGKSMRGEDAADTIRRELREELDLRVPATVKADRDLKPLLTLTLSPPEVEATLRLSFYRLDHLVFTGSQPRHREVIGTGWFTVDEALRLALTPGTRRLLESDCNLLGR